MLDGLNLINGRIGQAIGRRLVEIIKLGKTIPEADAKILHDNVRKYNELFTALKHPKFCDGVSQGVTPLVDGVHTSVLRSVQDFNRIATEDGSLETIDSVAVPMAPSGDDVVRAKLKVNSEYDNYINKYLLADDTPSPGQVDFVPGQSSYNINTAGENRLQRALTRLRDDFRTYESVCRKLNEENAKETKPGPLSRKKASVIKAENYQYKAKTQVENFTRIKQGIEDRIGVNTERSLGRAKRDGREEMMIAFSKLQRMIELELQQLDSKREQMLEGSEDIDTLDDPRLEDHDPSICPKRLTQMERLAFARDLKTPIIKYDQGKVDTELQRQGLNNVSDDIANVNPEPRSHFILSEQLYPKMVKGDIIANIQGDQYLGESTPLNQTNAVQLYDAIRQLNEVFNEYSVQIQTIQSERKRSNVSNDARKVAHQLEDQLGTNTTKVMGQLQREGRIGMLKAMHIMRGRMAEELTRVGREYPAEDLTACQGQLEQLTRTLDNPRFNFDRVKLKSTLDQLGLTTAAPDVPDTDDPFTARHRRYETIKLFNGKTNLESARLVKWSKRLCV